MHLIKNYLHWLHFKWPVSSVEALPEVNAHGETNIRGVYVVGDLLGKALLKFSADSGSRCVTNIVENRRLLNRTIQEDVKDIAIIGGGVSGHAAAAEAAACDLSYSLFETNQPFSTIENFPESKPIYLYPDDMQVQGTINFDSGPNAKEPLLNYLNTRSAEQSISCSQCTITHFEKRGDIFLLYSVDRQVAKAHRVILAIGRSGNYRTLDIPGAESKKVPNRLHDPNVYRGRDVLIVG